MGECVAQIVEQGEVIAEIVSETNFFTDIGIPLLSSIIGGVIALLGVWITIRSGNRTVHKEYLSKIKPFLVVDDLQSFENYKDSIKHITFEDDALKEIENIDDKTLFWWDFLLSNVSDDICILNYIKINGEKYKAYSDIPIKPGEMCLVKGYPFSAYHKKQIESIVLGVDDKQFNTYEYSVLFSIGDDDSHKDDSFREYNNKRISFSRIDCRGTIVKKRWWKNVH